MSNFYYLCNAIKQVPRSTQAVELHYKAGAGGVARASLFFIHGKEI